MRGGIIPPSWAQPLACGCASINPEPLLRRREHLAAAAVALDDEAARDGTGERLAVVATGAAATFTGVAEVAAFHEHGGVFVFAQHAEIGELHAAIHGAGEGGDLVQDILRRAGGDAGVVIDLGAVRAGVGRVVEVDAHEERVALAIGDAGALVEFDESVVAPSHHGAKSRRLQLGPQPHGDFERAVLFAPGVAGGGAAIVATVPGIYHHAVKRAARVLHPARAAGEPARNE